MAAGISGSGGDLQAQDNGWGTRFELVPWTGPYKRKDEGEREKTKKKERNEGRHDMSSMAASMEDAENPSCSLQRAPPWLPHFSVRIRTQK